MAVNSIEEMPPSKRRPINLLVNGSVVVSFTRHAESRCLERGIDPEEVIHRISGKPVKSWKRVGVIGEFRRGVVKIVTVWNIDRSDDGHTQ